ncbi:unnamed protein product [Didymodactylos carnosus]|uniref:CDP-diacylglycerol--inositol 3-phosphatidyltransferase n=1 Tax=Didymodactylos carnosus TaxID=1234261 RepID=A0A814MUW0_9BILA|nr:unnamed protein product [Didymodactylos carnosus]CAF1081499.1 unnamed protein product [Didymodactylos carnosus]CAF3669545.1 unnamed protein product [Didymodactylos carnosus]CAF3847452.1 unnamed protein product [Didymodactylos carnosus]
MTNLTGLVDPVSILLNIPNVLAYIRILLLYVSIKYFSCKRYSRFLLIYFISGLCDLADGELARLFHQTSIVGGVFEIFLDQFSHLILYVCTACLYRNYMVYFLFEIGIEIMNDIVNFHVKTLNIKSIEEQWNSSKTIWLHQQNFIDQSFLYKYIVYGTDIFHFTLIIYYIINKDQQYNFKEIDYKQMIPSFILQIVPLKIIERIIYYTIWLTLFSSIQRSLIKIFHILHTLENIAKFQNFLK